MIEKQYGGPVKAMSPINQINKQYEQLLNRSLDTGKNSKRQSRKAFIWDTTEEEDSGEQSFSISPTSKKGMGKNDKKQQSYQGKIPRLLENLHSPVQRVSLNGMNSTDRSKIDFVANSSG